MNTVPSWDREEVTLRRSEWTRPRDEDRAIRELNKRLKQIYEDDGKEYGEDVDRITVIERVKVAREIRSKQIEDVFRLIRRARSVELCFLVDCTGSMQPHIDGVKASIRDIVNKLTNTERHVRMANDCVEVDVQELKLAFVGYRDHGDSKQFEVLRFTSSTEEFRRFCEGIQASGGADTCEDIHGGLEKSLELNWSDNVGTKVIFHICDAPCHGQEFHDSSASDSYSTGDPKGRSHVTLFSKLRSFGIQYYFGKINSSTDIMMKKFAETYGEPIVDFDVKNVEKIRDSVITAVSLSVSASIAVTKVAGGARRVERVFSLETAEPDWTRCSVQKGKFISYDFPDSIKDIVDDIPLGRRQPKSAEVKIAPSPFSKGAERVAFFGRDVSTFIDAPLKTGQKPKLEVQRKQEDIVLKEYLHKGKGMNSAKRYELSNQLQTVAAFLAMKFVDDLKSKTGEVKVVKFVKIRTLMVGSDSGQRFMSAERRFASTDKFVRFTNNTDYGIMEEKALNIGVSLDFVQLVMAFSHWTYKVRHDKRRRLRQRTDS